MLCELHLNKAVFFLKKGSISRRLVIVAWSGVVAVELVRVGQI